MQSFPGSLLLVTHDRALLDAVGTRTVAVEDQTLHSYVGGWAEYVRVRAERAEDEKTAKAAKPKAPDGRAKAAPKQDSAATAKPRSKNAQARAKKLESEIEVAEAALAALEDELADPGAWSDKRKAERATKKHAEAKQALEALYAEWESVAS